MTTHWQQSPSKCVNYFHGLILFMWRVLLLFWRTQHFSILYVYFDENNFDSPLTRGRVVVRKQPHNGFNLFIYVIHSFLRTFRKQKRWLSDVSSNSRSNQNWFNFNVIFCFVLFCLFVCLFVCSFVCLLFVCLFVCFFVLFCFVCIGVHYISDILWKMLILLLVLINIGECALYIDTK